MLEFPGGECPGGFGVSWLSGFVIPPGGGAPLPGASLPGDEAGECWSSSLVSKFPVGGG